MIITWNRTGKYLGLPQSAWTWSERNATSLVEPPPDPPPIISVVRTFVHGGASVITVARGASS